MAVSSDLADDLSEMVGGCCVCSDERGWDENPLVYCDGQGCNVAVHQACYGIVTVPSGPWFCRKCESQERAARVRCELCPSRDGALKRTDSNGWAHVVCALYIPEVRFGNVTTMEPILISLIPPERFNKTCCICDESSAKGSKSGVGACMQCNKPGCKQNFHVTCAQMLGLLCEEAGNMLDNVKYCGYCQYHYSKLKKTSNMKIIPPFRPVPNSPHQSTQGSESSSTQGNGSKEQISPDISKISGLKKKLSGSSSTSNSSKGSVSSSHHSSSAMPRIAPSNLFASSNSYSSLGKSSDRAEISPGDNVVQKPTEDSYVLKSDDLKSSSSSSEPKKFLKANNDFMTVKLNDVLTASLDRPIHETPPRDKAQPPDIKPHVTLTPIPMRSSDKPQDKSSGLFGQQTASIGKSKETTPLPPTLEAEGSLAEISPTLFSHETKHSPSKRSSRMSMDLDSPTSSHAAPDLKPVTGLDRATPPSWDSSKSQPSNQRGSSTDRVIVLASGSTGGSVEETSKNTSVDDQSSQPLKRGPGRPVKRRNSSGPSKEEERAEDPKKKSKRGGRRGGSSYSRNDSGDGPSFADENSNDGPKKQNGTTRKSNPMPKRQEETTPTLSQLRAQKESASKPESSTSILPAHMFGNALNPASSMAQRMVDTLSQEMETIVAAGVVLGEKEDKPSEKLVGIQLPKYAATSVLNGTPTNGTPSSSGSSSNPPQTLEQLLERQWEQGSQFLMEQAQHLDIAQLLSCLNQLKQDNRALEDHVSNLMQRKEQLIAINARLSIPLANSLAVGGGSGAVTGERGHDGPGTQQRPSPADIPVIHTQPQTNGRPVNYSGHQVPVVISSHPSPHLNQGHSGRQ